MPRELVEVVFFEDAGTKKHHKGNESDDTGVAKVCLWGEAPQNDRNESRHNDNVRVDARDGPSEGLVL